MHRVLEDAGGHPDQQQPGPGEERREVDPQRAGVQPPAEHHGCREAERDAQQRTGRGGGSLGGRVEQHRGFEPFADDGEERHAHDRERPHADRLGQACPQVPGEPAGGTPHPEDHPGHERDGGGRRDRVEQFTPVAWEHVAGHERQQRPEPDGDRDRGAGAGAHLRQPFPAPGFDEERDEDAHDQGGLEPLAQSDQVVAEDRGTHAASLPR